MIKKKLGMRRPQFFNHLVLIYAQLAYRPIELPTKQRGCHKQSEAEG